MQNGFCVQKLYPRNYKRPRSCCFVFVSVEVVGGCSVSTLGKQSVQIHKHIPAPPLSWAKAVL